MSITPAPAQADGLAQPIPLSFNQEFLRGFDKGDTDGAFGHRHTLVGGWRVAGAVDTAALQDALDDVVARHEVLRTEVSRGEGEGRQDVLPASRVPLEVRELGRAGDEPREVRAERFLNELDGGTYSVREYPHLRAVLGRFDAEDGVLVLVTHHTSTDAWSLQVIMRDLADRYAARTGGSADEPAPVAQYQDFARWQHESADSEKVKSARGYWNERLAGARITGVATDRPRTDAPTAYGVHRFVFGAELSAAVLAYSRTVRSTPFMIMSAAYAALLRTRTGTTDVVFPTFSAGRYEERFMDAVGPFFNFVPIRIDTTGCTTLGDVVEQARAACVGAYQHEIPFAFIAGDTPELLAPFADDNLAVVAFEVLQAPFPMDATAVGGLELSEIRRRELSQDVSSAIPDGGLWAMDVLPSGELAGSLKFDHNRFDEATARALVEDFRRLLQTIAEAPGTELSAL
ncbi:condensation domain-containing protein [Streptomyces bambusae]|uniref:condensation domain-containing protein n=1 Tax=Streptomyces bambusae TaxID=1550616 RepID=UPI001CFEDD03|nr:condensation domain-containing protein [Streptomyces bambusae]MCB5165636.1 condensation domain-containing protein [Streptomyces bambusae]